MLTVFRRQGPTQPDMRSVLQTYKTNKIPGCHFAAVGNLQNLTCGMFRKRIKLTEYQVDSLHPLGTTQPHVRNALQTYETCRIQG